MSAVRRGTAVSALDVPLAALLALLLTLVAMPLIATMPNRQGLATALDYLTSDRRPPESGPEPEFDRGPSDR